MLKLKLVLLSCFLPLLLLAEVWVYSQPDESIRNSPFYTVKVEQDGQQLNSFVNYRQVTSGDLKRSNSWTAFSFNNKITVEVEVLEGSGLIRQNVLEDICFASKFLLAQNAPPGGAPSTAANIPRSPAIVLPHSIHVFAKVFPPSPSPAGEILD